MSKNTKLVLSIDPSGNFINGKGKTGLVLAEVDEEGFKVLLKETIRAKDYDTHLDYWEAHMDCLDPGLDVVVVEDFMLYPGVNQSVLLYGDAKTDWCITDARTSIRYTNYTTKSSQKHICLMNQVLIQ